LLGHWKNFDELETNLSLEELTALLEASRKKDFEDKKFAAALQGVDLDDPSENIRDIAELKGYAARQEGFGVGEGLAYITMGGDEE
jgi:phytoene/squalene synthetase